MSERGAILSWLLLPGQRGPTQAPLMLPHKFQAPTSTSKHSCQGSRLPVNKARLLPNRIICILDRRFFPITHCIASHRIACPTPCIFFPGFFNCHT